MNGYKFEVLDNNNDFLKYLLINVKLDKYFILIEEDETIYKDNNSLFERYSYKYDEFYKIICIEDYYPIFMRLDFCKDVVGDERNKITPSDCINSNIDLIILVTDSNYCEIYCKDDNLLKLFFNNLMNNKIFKNIRKSGIISRKKVSGYSD